MRFRECRHFHFHRTNAAAISAIALSLMTPATVNSQKPWLSGAQITTSHTLSGYPYQTGGFTFDEQQAMTDTADDFNLRLTFASRTGALAVPEFVLIGSNQGGMVEKIALTAPWFHIQLPPGAYTVLTRFRSGVVLVRDIDLTEGQSRAMRVQAAN